MRRVPGPVRSSDERRGRALAWAVAAGILLVLGAAWWWPSPPTASAGAVAWPHRDVACGACHDAAAGPAAACEGCHGSHPSRRGPHRAMVEAGRMGCVSCHHPHQGDAGVTVAPSGEAWRYEVGRRVAVELGGEGPDRALTVPLVPREVCARCHGGPGDPAARCGEGRFSGCFDEHRDGLAAGSDEGACRDQHGPRFAAWDRARHAGAIQPEVAAPPATWPRWLLLGVVGACAAGGLAAGAGAFRRRREARRDGPVAVPMAPEARRLPVIDPSSCLGCYACVDACPYDVLRIDRYVAEVAHPEACCGLTSCESACPNGSLVMGPPDAVPALPRLDGMEVDGRPGLYLAGDVTGVPLIKTAILQGRAVVDEVAADLGGRRGEADLDVLVVGAGPAGISAGLRAQELGLSVVILEQGSIAQSIRSFPRGKLVFDQPLELPLVGPLWLQRSTKEELLTKWLRVVRQARLPVDEGRRFVSLEGGRGDFRIEAEDGEGRRHRYRAARVVLAIGTRGTPRQLAVPIPPEAEDRTFYSLADARTFAGARVVVVGLGDVAMECACALAAQPDTKVTVSYRRAAMTRGKADNRSRLQERVDEGSVELRLETEVEEVRADRVVLRSADGGVEELPMDALFVLIGSLPPRPLLERLGVRYGDEQTPLRANEAE